MTDRDHAGGQCDLCAKREREAIVEWMRKGAIDLRDRFTPKAAFAGVFLAVLSSRIERGDHHAPTPDPMKEAP